MKNTSDLVCYYGESITFLTHTQIQTLAVKPKQCT